MRRLRLPLVAAAVVAVVLSAGAASAQTPPSPIEVQVIMGDASIRTTMPSVPAGVPVRLVARNNGTISHQLALSAPNARGAVLLPGESHTIELTFGQPGTIQLFCPIGDVPLLPGVSHREKGVVTNFQITDPPAGVTIQATPAIAPAPQIAALTAPGANDDRVGLPENYRERLGTFYVFDRSDNRQVRHVFGNQQALSFREGQRYPFGSILVMETWRAKLGPDNQPALDANGRYQKDELAGIFVMRREPGFGAKYGPDRTGEWEYVAYRPDGTGFATAPDRSQACAQCHLAASDDRKDWVVRAALFLASPRAALPSLLRLPQTGHGPAPIPLPGSALALLLAAGTSVASGVLVSICRSGRHKRIAGERDSTPTTVA